MFAFALSFIRLFEFVWAFGLWEQASVSDNDDDVDLHECAARSCAKHSNAKTIENVYLNGCHAYFARFLFCFARLLAAATDADGAVAEHSFHFISSGQNETKTREGNFQS